MNIKIIRQEDKILLKRSINYLKPHKSRFIILFITIILSLVLGLVQPYIFGVVIANITKDSMALIAKSLIYLSITFVIGMLVNFFTEYSNSYLNSNIIYDLKRDMYRKIINLPVKAFDEIHIGDFMSRLNGDAGTLSDTITMQLITTVVDILKVIILGILVFSINIQLALIVVCTFPISYYIFLSYGRKLRIKNRELKELNDNYFSNIQQSIFGIRDIKSLGIKGKNFSEFSNLAKLLRDKDISLKLLNTASLTFSNAASAISNILIMGLGAYFVINKKLSLELFIAFSSYSMQFSSSLMNITKLNSNIQQALTSLERIFSLMDNLNYNEETFGEKQLEAIEGKIKFNNVRFGYTDNQNTLNGITFQVPPNKKLAIVGKSGVGKSTIFNLVLRFYDPVYGEITVDDINIKDFNEESLRKHISVIRQEPFLFNISIKDNLLGVNHDASNEDIYDACKAACIHDFILSLPQGYDSIIGENGINFSGGQKQRIAIARGLLKKSKVILFDEATSALDNESQYLIKKAIDNLSRDHTIIVIAHRLSTIIDADEILVMSEGRIVGQGSHNYLIKNNPVYQSLYETEINAAKDISEEVS